MSQRQIGIGEFVALAALLMSLVAMAIDAMLPALGIIAGDLGVRDANDAQLVVSVIFLGLAVAQMGFGPLSDSWGRKPTIGLGLFIFCCGCVISILSTSFGLMLVGRFLQGVGAAGPKIVTVALIRDLYKGAAMARIMSVIMAVFIVVPALAPALGQGILHFFHWRAIFILLLAQGAIAWLWFALRQNETLDISSRQTLQFGRFWDAVMQTLRNRVALGYTLAAGFVFGSFLGYLNSAQQIFQVQYGVGAWFPAYFGGLAVSLGLAAIFNARMVMRVGMYRLSLLALRVLTALSLGFLISALMTEGSPPLWALMSFLVPAFFCIGMLFGNFNALAMEPMGHIAGTAAAVIASLSTAISLVFGILIGRSFDGTILPLVAGMAGLSAVGLPILYWVRPTAPQEPSAPRNGPSGP